MKFSKIYALLMASAMVLGGCDQVDENESDRVACC